MRLFTRTVTMTGPPTEVLAFSSEMCGFVTKTTGVDVGLWSVQFGAPVGTMVYAARVEGLAQLDDMTASLMADPTYTEMLAKGADFTVGPPEDSLGTPLHGDIGGPPPVGTVVTGTRAVISGGKYGEAISWSIDMAQYSEKITGLPVGFYLDDFGTFGGVAWLSAAADAAAAEAAGAALNADVGYMDKLAEVGDLFLNGSGNRTLATRVA